MYIYTYVCTIYKMERDAQFKPLSQWIPSANKGQIDSHPSKIHQIRGYSRFSEFCRPTNFRVQSTFILELSGDVDIKEFNVGFRKVPQNSADPHGQFLVEEWRFLPTPLDCTPGRRNGVQCGSLR